MSDAYVARTDLDPRPHLAVYLAYNFFRLAAILQGIVGRVRDGTATSETAAAMAPLVRPLAATPGFCTRGGGTMTKNLAREKTFALALGGGGARGLGPYRRARSAGRYGPEASRHRRNVDRLVDRCRLCRWMSGKQIRRFVIRLAHNRADVFRRLIATRAGTFADLFSIGFGSATLVDAEKFCRFHARRPCRMISKSSKFR
jgi:hypothetical protein